MVRKVVLSIAGLYLVCGLVGSSLLAYAVPATSLTGRAYLTLIWPAMVAGSPFPKPPIPAWCFSF